MGISLQFLEYRPACYLREAYVSRVELAELFERRKRFRREPGIEHFLFLLRHNSSPCKEFFSEHGPTPRPLQE